MYRSQHKAPTLPRSLNGEIGIKGTHIPQLGDDHLLTQAVETSISAKRKRQTGPAIRKERRKAARTEKKLQKPQQKPESLKKRDSVSTPDFQSKIIKHDRLEPVDHLPSRNPIQNISQKSILKPSKRHRLPKDDESSSPPPDSSNKSIPRSVKERLAADNAEIAALEKALGVKDKKKLPKSFEEDGLDSLLDGLGDELSSNRTPSKRKRDEGEEWLDMKRKKACKVYRQVIPADPSDMSEDAGMDSSFEGLSDLESEDEDQDGGVGDLSTDSESNDDSMSQDSTGPSSDCAPTKNAIRENPYRAPVTAEVAAPKYTPPSLRNQYPPESEDLSRLRRKVQGLINRLSEANLISILGDIELLYQSNPRQYVSSTLLEILLGMLSDSASLQDTFIILHAGFITAVYKMIGPDFGAQTIRTIDEQFRLDVDAREDDASSGKKLTNLASLLSSLYTFQLIGSKLIYDYIKMFIEDLSEGKVELLLKILRNSGPQLRQDDPSALKEIVLQVQRAVGKIGEENLSVRTKFMIETINNLKNNRMKTGIAASTTMSEHVIRMKKTLGSLNTRSVRASEPLRIGVSDIRESDKRGKWWLIGASYKDQVNDVQDNLPPREKTHSQDATELGPVQGTADDLLQMARAQGMNTSVRQSIFKTIMSASDYNNAFQLLMTLALRKSQEPEIAKVIVHCAGAEQAYNPYYSLLSRRLCAARGKYKMAFQFSLWGIFKRLGDGPDDDPADAEEDSGTLPMRTIVNLAKMFGALVAEGGLTLNILKVLNFPYLQPKTGIFVELMIITIILRTQKGVDDSSDESRLTEIFVQANGNAGLAQGLQRFLKKTVSRTDVAGTKADSETLRNPPQDPSLPAPPMPSNNQSIVFSVDEVEAMRRKHHDLVIIGGGVAGYVAAIKAGQEGLKVACIEKRGALGGTCLNVGCIPSKSLLNNSHMYHQILHDTKKRGIDVGDVKLNLKQMMAAKDTSVQGLTKGVEFLFKKNNVEYIPGTGALSGEHEVKVNKIDGGEATLLAKNILIATGSEATPFPGLTIDEKRVITSTGAINLQEVPKKMVVIGGGIIGLEMGSVWSRLGSDVTVVEFLGQIGGPGMDAEISKTTQKILGKQGMKFKLGTKVLSGDDSGETLKLEVEAAKGGKKETLDADVVLVAIGRRPYTAGLGLENIDLDVDNKGRLVIDEQYRTKHPHIRVIGDCTFGPMLAHKAEEEAVAAIEYITKGHGHVNYGAIPSVMYTHPEVAWVGQNEAELKEQGIKYRAGSFPFSANSRAKTNLETEGMVKFLSDVETDRILGIHIVGPNAGEMIAEGVLAIEYGASSEDVARTSHAHPTLAEAFKEAAMATYSKAIHY
ncbi:MAG: hypothetical protein Q9180_003560 [Flavoplaca navasiana]